MDETPKKPKRPKPVKIEWAEDTVIEALNPFVDELLQTMAEVFKQKGFANAMVSDRSMIGDFLKTKKTGKTVDHPIHKGHKIDVVTSDIPENHERLAEVSKRLGVEVGWRDYIYEIAIRMRDKK